MAALRSVRMSPKRFDATMTSKSCGRRTRSMQAASTSSDSVPDVRILARDLGEDPIPEPHAEALRVRLRDRRQRAACALRRRARSNANRMTRSVPCRVNIAACIGHFVRPAWVEQTADLRVLALGVLAHDDEVDFAGLPAGQRAAHAGVEHGRPHARVLIEAAADRQQQTVQRDVVLQSRIADRAEEDRVERTQPVERVGRHHAAVLEVVVGAPGELLPLEPEAASLCLPLRGRGWPPESLRARYRRRESPPRDTSRHAVTTARSSSTIGIRSAARSPGAPAR